VSYPLEVRWQRGVRDGGMLQSPFAHCKKVNKEWKLRWENH